MKRIISILLAVVMLTFSLPAGATKEEAANKKYNPFDDVPKSHYAYEEISFLYLWDIVSGKSKTEFAPEEPIKREEFAKIITKALDEELSTNTGSFTDVLAGSWYEPYVETTKEANIYKGITENVFGVGEFVTKQDCALLMQRLSDIKPPVFIEETSEILPADIDIAADYAKDAITELAKRCVIKTAEGENFNPASYATRAEVCQMLFGILSQADPLWDTKHQWWNFSKPIPDDKLTEQMPKPYDVNNFRQQIIGTYDFESEDLGVFELGYCPGKWEIVNGEGVDGSRCVKVEMPSTGLTQYQLAYKDVNAKPGDWYSFKAKIKVSGLTTTGTVSPLLQVYGDDGKWLGEDNRSKANDKNMKDGEWVERSGIISIPREANTLDEGDDFYTVRIHAFINGVAPGSVAYFDDFELTKVLFDPMETALVTPNYKGMIYGNDGVSDINLRVWLYDYNGGFDISDWKLENRIIDADDKVYATSELESLTKQMDVTFSSNILELNKDYYLETKLISKSTGELMNETEWTLRVREEDYRPLIHVDKYNRLIQDGEITFPQMQYTWVKNEMYYDDHIELNKGRNTDVVSMGEIFHRAGYNTLFAQQLRKDMEEEGLKGKLGFAGFCFSNMYSHLPGDGAVKTQPEMRDLIEQFCERFKDDPLLFCYYNWDEQNPVRYGPELKWQADIQSNADPDHPNYGILDELHENRPGVYAKTADIIGCDPYVCTGKETQQLGDVSKRITLLKDLAPNKPQSVCLQGFWFKKRGDLRGPTQQEYRNMVWQAIVAGVSLMDNYAITDVHTDPWGDQTYEEIWEEQMLVYDEVNLMKPVILSREPAPYYETKGGGEWLNTTARRYDGKSYVFAVNNEGNTKQFRLYLDNITKIKGMYTDKEYTADENGWFKIDLEGYEVEIFEFSQEDYLSPHAELIRFGVSNKDHSYVVTDFDAETPVINIDDDAQKLDFLATVSDYATVYINDVKMGELSDVKNVGVSGSIDITGIDSINVKVVSEDGRFSNEQTYLLSRSVGEEG